MVQRTSHPSKAAKAGLAKLATHVAPAEIRVVHRPTNALPFRLECPAHGRMVVVYGLTPDAAADEALAGLQNGSFRPTTDITLPLGQGPFVDALHDWIEVTEQERAQTPRLRLLRPTE